LLSTALADGRFIDEGVFGSNAVIDGDGGWDNSCMVILLCIAVESSKVCSEAAADWDTGV
jgi:hypothetical protein